jgi:ATP-dependent DNA ligase
MKALADMRDDTVIDGEVVALDESGRPSFSALQHYGASNLPLVFTRCPIVVFASLANDAF